MADRRRAPARRPRPHRAWPNARNRGRREVRLHADESTARREPHLHPPILLYDGEGDDAKFAGLSYVVKGTVPGFAGCFDVWHSHPSVCIDKERRITLTEAHSWRWYSEAECTAHGGHVMKLAADKMIHVFDGYYPKRGGAS